MQVFLSRFTPGASGDQVSLDMGEEVRYKTIDGNIVDVVIDSERMTHPELDEGNGMGYECYPKGDKDDRFFADGKRIIFNPHYWE